MKKNKVIFAVLAFVVVSVAVLIPSAASARSSESDLVVMGEYTATISQSEGLTDQELIDLFRVSTIDGSDIRVDSHYINYQVPGTYQVNFSSVNADFGFQGGFLTVVDSEATITTTTDQASVMQNSTVDYKELFGVQAQEITPGDLNDKVVVDDSAVNLSSAGDYPVVFSVTDAQGSTITKTVTLTVLSGKPVITGDYFTKLDARNAELSDTMLIALFNIESSENTIVVNQDEVDYHTPGEYHISFTSTNSYGSTTFQSALIVE